MAVRLEESNNLFTLGEETSHVLYERIEKQFLI